MPKLGDQIAGLVQSLGNDPAAFYGGSSGGLAILDLVVHHGEIVRNAIVHEVPMARATASLVTSSR